MNGLPRGETAVIVGLAIVVALLWLRARYLRSLEQIASRGRARGADGVIVGAEPFTYARPGAPAVLLIHGAGDTPQTLRYLGNALYAHGFHVTAPLLPGHGRSLFEFSHITADDLTRCARAAYDELQRRHDWVAIVGLSMGGALAAQLAAGNDALPALGLVAPYLAMPRAASWAARAAWLWGPILPAVSSSEGVSVLDPDERSRNLAYGVFTPAAVRALHETMRRGVAALPTIVAPTIFMQSTTDNRIATKDAQRAFDLLGAREKRLEWV
ncbi:MAG TPA: alpha/beta fold hydrolase, partial [Gemmatimonadaceae bacterium]|nr:alpha/beta fold hydrolase [Gemmatimonadaceae bacterium]